MPLMQNLGYYNGTVDTIENMRIPMTDRACWFGDGVYEAAHARNHCIFALDEHLDRLYRGAQALEINMPISKHKLANLLNTLVTRVVGSGESAEQFVYWQVTRGSQPLRSHNFPVGLEGNLWITIEPRAIDPIDMPIKAITAADTRHLHCNIKTLNLIPSVMAIHAASASGCDEAILHRDGVVTECAHSNVHILQKGILRTHPADHLILPGIARAHLIAACERLGIPVDEHPFTVRELMNADEILITSSGSFCQRVERVDGQQVGGEAPDLLQALQKDLISEYLRETNVIKAS